MVAIYVQTTTIVSRMTTVHYKAEEQYVPTPKSLPYNTNNTIDNRLHVEQAS